MTDVPYRDALESELDHGFQPKVEFDAPLSIQIDRTTGLLLPPPLTGAFQASVHAVDWRYERPDEDDTGPA